MHGLDALAAYHLNPAAACANAAAASTPSGSWQQISHLVGQIFIAISLGSVTGSGDILFKARCSAANTGANAVDCASANGIISVDPTAAGAYVLILPANQPLPYVGLVATFTGITACVMSAKLFGQLGR